MGTNSIFIPRISHLWQKTTGSQFLILTVIPEKKELFSASWGKSMKLRNQIRRTLKPLLVFHASRHDVLRPACILMAMLASFFRGLRLITDEAPMLIFLAIEILHGFMPFRSGRHLNEGESFGAT